MPNHSDLIRKRAERRKNAWFAARAGQAPQGDEHEEAPSLLGDEGREGRNGIFTLRTVDEILYAWLEMIVCLGKEQCDI
jgi:hypothetical protein